MHSKAKVNEYQQRYPQFEGTPKAVIAAIALSLALRLSEDNFDAATELCREEWEQLYQAGIVPNRPA